MARKMERSRRRSSAAFRCLKCKVLRSEEPGRKHAFQAAFAVTNEQGCPGDLSGNVKADGGARMGFDGQRGMVAPFGSPSRPGLDGFGGGFSPFGSSRNCLLYNAPSTRGGGVRKRTEARLAKEREPRCGHTLIGDREVRPIGHKQPPGVTCAGPREGRIRDHEVPRP